MHDVPEGIRLKMTGRAGCGLEGVLGHGHCSSARSQTGDSGVVVSGTHMGGSGSGLCQGSRRWSDMSGIALPVLVLVEEANAGVPCPSKAGEEDQCVAVCVEARVSRSEFRRG